MIKLEISNVVKIYTVDDSLRSWLRKSFTLALEDTSIAFFDEYLDYVEIPRGGLSLLLPYLQKNSISFEIEDNTCKGEPVNYTSDIRLRPGQESLAEPCLRFKQGVIIAPPGVGKTVIGMWVIAQRGLRALWVTHADHLVDQALDAAEEFLKINRDDVGIIKAQKFKIGEKITIASSQTLANRDLTPFKNYWGIQIFDECHRFPSLTVVKSARAINPAYLYGFSATPTRTDGLEKAINFYLGNTICELTNQDAVNLGLILNPTVYVKQTGIVFNFNFAKYKLGYIALINDICNNVERNKLIIDTIADLYKQGRTTLCFSLRQQHCFYLANLLNVNYGIASSVITTRSGEIDEVREKYKILFSNSFKKIYKDIEKGAGITYFLESLNDLAIKCNSMMEEELAPLKAVSADAVVDKELKLFKSGVNKIAFSTFSKIQDGFDLKDLDAVILTAPSKSVRLIVQSIGRSQRIISSNDKNPIIINFLDQCVISKKHLRENLVIFKDRGIDVKYIPMNRKVSDVCTI